MLEMDALTAALAGYAPDWLRLTGGEPLLRRDVAEVAGRLGGRRLAICTNLLTPRWPAVKAWIEAHVHLLAVSLDTLNPSVYLHFRGEPMGDLVARLRSLASWAASPGRDLVLSTVLTPTNIPDVEAVGRFAAAEGFADFREAV